MRTEKLNILSAFNDDAAKSADENISSDANNELLQEVEADVDKTVKSSNDLKDEFVQSMKSIKEVQLESFKNIA